MAKSLVFRHSSIKRNRIRIKRKTVSRKIKESKATLGFVVVFLVCAMGFVYVSEINNVATKGYEIEDYKKRLIELEKENQRMMVELADLKSINLLDGENNNFVAVDYKDIAYITSISDAVAME